MNNKRKIIIAFFVVCLLIAIIGASSFAYFKKNKVSEDENIISTLSCFDIEFTDGAAITLTDTFPISEEEGRKTKPYTFTLTNKCDNWVKFDINIESLAISEKKLPDSYLKANLNSGITNIITTKLEPSLEVEPKIEGAEKSYKLYSDYLKPNGSLKYTLRMWVHEGVTYDDASINSYFEGQISIVGSLYENPFVNSKTLMATNGTDEELPTGAFWDYRDSISKIVFQEELSPIATAAYSFDVSEAQDNSVMSYLVPNANDSLYTLYIQADEGIKLNEDSSYYFSGFSKLMAIEGWNFIDSSNVTSMKKMFANCLLLNNINIQYLDTTNVTDMSSMFENCSNLENIGINELNIANVTTMANMFKRTGITNFELSNNNLENLIDMSGILEQSLVKSIDLSNTNAPNLLDLSNAFAGCNELVTIDFTNFNASSIENMANVLKDDISLSEIDLSTMVLNNVKNMNLAFSGNLNLRQIKFGNFTFGENGIAITMFANCKSLNSIDLSNVDASTVTDFNHFFANLENLKELKLDNFKVRDAIDMSYMFYYCRSLESIVLSDGFDTSSATNMSYMFDHVGSARKDFYIDLGNNFDTSNVKNMAHMFEFVASYSLELSLNLGGKFDTSKVTNMNHMFSGTGSYSSIFTLNLGEKFDTSNVTDMNSMFMYFGEEAEELTLDLGDKFDTSNVTDMSSMFSYVCSSNECKKLVLNLGDHFDTSNVTNMFRMFEFVGHRILSPIPINLNKFNTSKVTNMSGMFMDSCVSGNISNFDFVNVKDIRFFADGSSFITGEVFIDFRKTSQYSYAFNMGLNSSIGNITINYISSTESILDSVLSEYNRGCLATKGKLLDASEIGYHQITLPTELITSVSLDARINETITLTSLNKAKVVSAFKLNGNRVVGDWFIMPDEDVEITDIEFEDILFVESKHNPYDNNEDAFYYQNTFEGATSITIELTYQTENINYDWIEIHTTTLYNKFGGTYKMTSRVTIPGDTVAIKFHTDGSVNNYYGFSATIIPNYD